MQQQESSILQGELEVSKYSTNLNLRLPAGTVVQQQPQG